MDTSTYINDVCFVAPIVNGTVGTYVNITEYLESFKVDIMDIESQSGRTTNGAYIKNKITTKRRISLTFRPLSPTESNIVLTPLMSGVYIGVKYLDPVTSSTGLPETITAYVSDRTVPYIGLKGISRSGAVTGLWNGLSFELTER